MYTRTDEDPLKEKVIFALESYKNDTGYAGAGYDILRYAKMGRIGTDASAQDFLDWYPSNSGFIILRLAKAGKLYYKEPK